jgi:succinate-semialdehyde dehydrogenase/glutarate-semialdehyde dehydrogenase
MYHDRDFGLYIGGQWSWGSGKQTKPILDPATEGVIGHIPDANAEDIDGALSAMGPQRKASESLGAAPPAHR